MLVDPLPLNKSLLHCFPPHNFIGQINTYTHSPFLSLCLVFSWLRDMDDSTTSNSTINLVVLLIFMGQLAIATAAVEYEPISNQSTTGTLQPAAGATEYKLLTELADTERRRLASPYQLCLLCKCCSATTCTSMPCCFAIDCQLPNKPFGVCAFVPKTCNCINCSSTG